MRSSRPTTLAARPTSWATKLFPENAENIENCSALQFPPLPLTKPKAVKEPERTPQEATEPYAMTADDLDQSNTRVFIKSLSPDLHSYELMYSTFRRFGKIRMIALNTKRHNAIVEFDTKEDAFAAKRDGKVVVTLSGRSYTIKMFWGKRIDREPPVKNAPPTLLEQISFVRNVHFETKREKESPLPSAYIHTLRETFKSNRNAQVPIIWEEEDDEDEELDLPPGIVPTSPVLARSLTSSTVDSDHGAPSLMRASHSTLEVPETNNFSRLSRPTVPVKTPALSLERIWSPEKYALGACLAGLLTLHDAEEMEAFSNFDLWVGACQPLSGRGLDFTSRFYSWEPAVNDFMLGSPSEAQNHSSASTLGSLPLFDLYSPHSASIESLLNDRVEYNGGEVHDGKTTFRELQLLQSH